MVVFKNLDKDADGKMDHVVVEIPNDMGTGSARIREVKLDGVAIPCEKVTVTVGSRPSRTLDPASEIYSEYGDTIKLEIPKDGGLTKGEHVLGITASIGWREQLVNLKGTL